MTGFILSLSVYAEQIVVNRFGSVADSASYFASSTYFLFPVSFINGFIAFLIGPWIRDNHDEFVRILHKCWLAILFSAFIVAGVLNLMAWILWRQISPSAGVDNHILQILFFFVSVIRLLYSLPSGYLGVFGLPNQHDRLIIMQILSLLPVLSIFFVLQWSGVALVYSVAAASLVNWFLRTMVSYNMISIVNSSRLYI
jgi:hypothetical protein